MNMNDMSKFFGAMGESEENKKKIADRMLASLDDTQKQKINAALNDPKLLHKLMTSPEALKIISKFSEKEKRE